MSSLYLEEVITLSRVTDSSYVFSFQAKASQSMDCGEQQEGEVKVSSEEVEMCEEKEEQMKEEQQSVVEKGDSSVSS